VVCRWNEFCTVGRYYRHHATGLHQQLCFVHHYCLSQVVLPPTHNTPLANAVLHNTERRHKTKQFCIIFRKVIMHKKGYKSIPVVTVAFVHFLLKFLPFSILTLNDIELPLTGIQGHRDYQCMNFCLVPNKL